MRAKWARTLLISALTAVAALAVAIPAHSDPAYTADSLVSIFAKDKQAVDQFHNKTRKVCLEDDPDPSCHPKAPTPTRVDLYVNFEFDSNVLTPAAKANLAQVAEALKDPRVKGAKFAIDGFTDATGGEQYNLGLSERRAQAVVAYLVSLGVDPTALQAKGFGKAQPRASDPFSPENRRVETHIAE